MKTGILAIIATVLFGVNYGLNTSSMSTQNSVHSSNALPEHGVIIVTPSDPTFDDKVASLTRGNAETKHFFEQAKPLLAFIENESDKSVVAYDLTWNAETADGKVLTQQASYASPGVLMGSVENANLATSMSGVGVRPKSFRLISMNVALSELLNSLANSTSESTTTPVQDAIRKHLDYLSTNILKPGLVTKITVGLDGLFFEDGKFAGNNKTGLFENMQAEVAAKQDLADFIDNRVKLGKNKNDLLADVKQIAKDPASLTSSTSPLTEHYKHFLKIYAEEILEINRRKGADSAVNQGRQMLTINKPKLHKSEN